MTYRPPNERPPLKMRPSDVVEFQIKDAWIATRFALRERRYSDPPPRRAVIRYKLGSLRDEDIERLVAFCRENGAGARFITPTAARIRPHPDRTENDRLMRESHGILFEIEA